MFLAQVVLEFLIGGVVVLQASAQGSDRHVQLFCHCHHTGEIAAQVVADNAFHLGQQRGVFVVRRHHQIIGCVAQKGAQGILSVHQRTVEVVLGQHKGVFQLIVIHLTTENVLIVAGVFRLRPLESHFVQLDVTTNQPGAEAPPDCHAVHHRIRIEARCVFEQVGGVEGVGGATVAGAANRLGIDR